MSPPSKRKSGMSFIWAHQVKSYLHLVKVCILNPQVNFSIYNDVGISGIFCILNHAINDHINYVQQILIQITKLSSSC